MSKEIIAVDIDDVLADNAQGFIAFSNERWGTNLTVDDYDEHWGEMWRVDEAEVMRRSEEFHMSDAFQGYAHRPEAKPVLLHLAERHELVITTSRRSIASKVTKAWIDTYYEGIFTEIRHAGFYDEGVGLHLTKANLCQEIGATYLIDDQPKHALAAAKVGVKSLLFGMYGWNKIAEPLPENVVRVTGWQGVREYFDAV